MMLLVYQKHTQWPGPGRTEENVVGYPMMPIYAAKAGGFFFIVFGVTALMGGLLSINPVWRFGPYNPSEVTAGSQPDWYMGVAEGLLRIMPGWETAHLRGHDQLERPDPGADLPVPDPRRRCSPTRSSSSGSPATSGSTTCSSARATPPTGRRSWSR